MARLLQIFAKAPRPGEVKTRLAPVLGEAGACELYRRMLHHVLREMTPAFRVQLWCTPDTSDIFFHCCKEMYGVELCIQTGEDLGARMANALHAGLAETSNVVLIGSDCPGVTVNYVEQAFDALQTYPVVFGPAADGGYVLVGVHQHVPDIFQDMVWSTATVLEETRVRLRQAKITAHELDTQWDVDEPADLVNLQQPTYRHLLI